MAGDDDALLSLVRAQGRVTPGELAAALGVARMTAYRRLDALVKKAVLKRTAPRGRDVAYVLAPVQRTWKRAGLDESDALAQVEPLLAAQWALAKDDAAAFAYVFTEMVNNAIDHSGGAKVSAAIDADHDGGAGMLRLVITDDGVGAFERVRKERSLPSLDDAVLQIEKGKETTMPERHTGEGLFFSSKVAQRFRVEANGRAWLVEGDDSTLERSAWRSGTRVTAWFRPGHVPRLEDVFGRYTEDGAFTKTKTTVKLADVGSTFLSRSEARRVAAGLDRFTHVTLDFHGVERVGQGFADELFRVFQRAHPDIRLEPVRMSEDVSFMVARALPSGPSAAPPDVVAPPPRAPGDAALERAFVEMQPTRVLRAAELARAARAASGAAQAVLAVRALCELVNARALDDTARARLAALMRDEDLRAVARADALDGDGAVAAHLAERALARVTATPRLWRWFVDDDDTERFFALPEEQRRALWGPPVDA